MQVASEAMEGSGFSEDGGSRGFSSLNCGVTKLRHRWLGEENS